MATEATLRKKPGTWLAQYLGIKEGSTEHKAILAVFNDSGLCTRYKMTTSDAWCATAASAAFIACGLASIFPCVECSCSKMITLAKAAGIWVESDSYVPGIGDLVIYDWQDAGSGDNSGTPDHVGIVTSVSSSNFKEIEGNKSDTVGYRTVDINGKFIRGFITPNFASIATSDNDSGNSGTLAAGTKVTLKSAKLYASATSGTAAGTKTGTFYIWSATQTNGRIRITTSASYVGVSGKITGWVNVSDITGASGSASYAVGDKVTVNGTIYGNGNGTGGSIKKSNETMYVVNVVDSSEYTYYIGLAAKKGGTRQGWAKPSILS